MGDREVQALDALSRHLADADYGNAERVLREYAADRVKDSPEYTEAQEYRMLADKLSSTMAVPDGWDGDDAEVSILMDYVDALPEIIRHQVAEELRRDDPLSTTMQGQVADRIDPFCHHFELLYRNEWIRKDNGRWAGERMLKGVVKQ